MNTLRLRFSGWVLFGLLIGTLLPAAPAESADHIIDQETHIRYIVRPGDTLWSISARFFDTPEGWPDLWSRNPHIANPHRLKPGDTIFLVRDIRQEITAEPAEDRQKPIQQPLPPEKPIRSYRYPGMERVGFLQQNPIPPAGEIISVQKDKEIQKEMISQGDKVIIRSRKGDPLPVGGRYTVFRILDPIRHPHDNQRTGYPHYLTGRITILESEGDLSLGEIDNSYRSIQAHDLLMDYQPPPESIPLVPGISSISGIILCTEEQDGIFAAGALVYIDKGALDGIQPGQTYFLYTTEPASPAELLFDYGEILVLRVMETTSTALITHTDRPIRNAAGFHGTSSRKMVRRDLP
jgi:hypothetical protein